MHYITCKALRCPHTEDHCLPVFHCSHNYPYLLSALPKCSCPFSCSLTSFNINCLCSPAPQLKLTMFHCSQPSRIVWVHLTNTTLYVQVGLTTLEPHVLSAICSYSFEPHVRFVLEITSKMTWCSAWPTRVQICNEGVSF